MLLRICGYFIEILSLKHRDEARHGKAFEGLLKRYFSK